MRENQRHTVPAFFLKCVVLQLTMKYSRTIPPSLPCENMLYCNVQREKEMLQHPSLPCENMLYCNIDAEGLATVTPSLPCENMLYCNQFMLIHKWYLPSLPCENMLYCNLKWHYRLLINFNLSTNEVSMIPIHLYFRHYCLGP